LSSGARRQEALTDVGELDLFGEVAGGGRYEDPGAGEVGLERAPSSCSWSSRVRASNCVSANDAAARRERAAACPP
jgi:hypothetical protein